MRNNKTIKKSIQLNKNTVGNCLRTIINEKFNLSIVNNKIRDKLNK